LSSRSDMSSFHGPCLLGDCPIMLYAFKRFVEGTVSLDAYLEYLIPFLQIPNSNT
jgi:hypothetical protein